jgi:3-deoxy-D-arabino-heptulosonate 7-phosphate (DAHP) synthase class II
MASIHDVPTIVARFPRHIGAACAGVEAIETPTEDISTRASADLRNLMRSVSTGRAASLELVHRWPTAVVEPVTNVDLTP